MIISNKELNVAYKLKPVSIKGLTFKELNIQLEEQLNNAKAQQQELILLNQGIDFTRKTSFSNADARSMIMPVGTHKPIRAYPWDEMMRSEARRLLSTWQKKVLIAEYLEENGWKVGYKDRPEHLKFIKRNEWNNVVKSGQRPSLPTVKKARIVLSKSSSQYAALEQDDQFLRLFLSLDKDECVLEFFIPNKVWSKYKGFTATRPDIQLNDKGEITFTFSLKKKTIRPNDSNNVTGFDLGLVKPFVGVRIQNSKASFVREPSIETKRSLKAKQRLDEKITFLERKNRARASLGIINQNAILEEERLRAKRKRAIESVDWQIASDIVEYSGNSIIVLEELSWGEGGPVKFRHSSVSDKVEHKAKKNGKKVKYVSAKNTSHECARCGSFLEPDSKRDSTCDSCGYSLDRDDMAAVVIAKRGASINKVSLPKGRPTNSRPRKRKKKRVIFKSKGKLGFTGLKLAITTGGVDPTAILVSDYGPAKTSTHAYWRKRSEKW